MIELTVLIGELRRQLAAAIADGADEELHFELGPIELEASVVVSRESSGSGKVSFWVVEGGGSVKGAESSTQRIKLTLQPKIAGPNTTPWIAGRSGINER